MKIKLESQYQIFIKKRRNFAKSGLRSNIYRDKTKYYRKQKHKNKDEFV